MYRPRYDERKTRVYPSGLIIKLKDEDPQRLREFIEFISEVYEVVQQSNEQSNYPESKGVHQFLTVVRREGC